MKTKLMGVCVGTVLSLNLASAQEPLTTPPREMPRLGQPVGTNGRVMLGQPVTSTGPVVVGTPGPMEPTAFSSFGMEMGPFADCGHHLYGGAESLLWWIRDGRIPPLLSSGTQSSLGLLDRPGSVVLLGNDKIDTGGHWGGRFTVGWWLDDAKTVSVEANYIMLEDRSKEDSFHSPGSPLLTRPFFDAFFGRENGEPLAFPGIASGGLGYAYTSRLHGGEIDCVSPILCGYKSRIDLVSGIRCLNFSEDLDITSNSLVTIPPQGSAPPTSATINVFDHFDTENRFCGWNIALRQEMCMDHWFINVRTGIALGATNRNIRIYGSRSTANPNGVSASPDGLLAMKTNSGEFSDTVFDCVPELGINVGVALSPGFRMYAGYTFLYWMHAVRPGDQIDRAINTTQSGNGTLAGLPRPLVPFHDDDVWLQGISLGVELKW